MENSDIKKIIEKVVKKNEKAVSDYKNGNNNSINFLIGEVLKETKYQASVEKIREIIMSVMK